MHMARTVINDILSDSLQALSDEDLRPMSEAIENMRKIGHISIAVTRWKDNSAMWRYRVR